MTDRKMFTGIEETINRAMETSVFPGTVISVIKDGREVFNAVRGYRQIFPVKEKMTSDTLFDMASLTKPLATAPVALTVFEKERIALSRELGSFFPDLPAASKQITLEQLLTHTSGLPPVPDIYKLFPSKNEIDREKALRHLFSLEPDIPPGSNILYSCTGYIFLARVLHKITGLSLSGLYEKIITNPAGIKNMMFNPGADKKHQTAATEFCEWRNQWIRGEVHDENSFCLGGEGGNAGLFGNTEAVKKLLSIFVSGGRYGNKQLLSPETISLMTTCLAENSEIRRTAGFLMQSTTSFAGNLYSSKAFGHTGFTGTSVWIDPVCKITVIVLTNRVHFGREKTAEKIKIFREEFHSAVFKEFC